MKVETVTQEPKPKITLVLKDSEHADVGLVLDTLGTVPCELSDNLEVIGNWQRLKIGIVVELTTSVEARQDILINLLKELSVPKYKSTVPVLPIHKRGLRDAEKTEAPKQQEDTFTTKYEDLRRRLRGL